MTPEEFRALALGLPEAAEGAHMGHADFRVRGKIFASLGWPDAEWAVVMLSREDQAMRVASEPAIFEPVAGTWGERGSTKVRLAAADAEAVKGALLAAWRKVAPKRLWERNDG